MNFICEECKDVLTQFYIFKQNSKNNLLSSIVFDRLKEFLDSAGSSTEPIVKCTENRFIVAFDVDYDATDEVVAAEIEQVEEEVEIVNNNDILMTIEDADEPYYEMETVNEESEAALTDQEYEVQNEIGSRIKTEKPKFELSTYQCECGAQSLSIGELQRHINMHKRKSSSTKLNCCDVGFKDLKCFDIHEKAHENFDAIAPHLQSFSCSHCRVMFSCEEDLISHHEQHGDGCETVENLLIDRRSAYDDHLLRPVGKSTDAEADGDGDEDLFSCGHCVKKLNETDMKVHLLFFHTNIVFCPLDNRCFEGNKQVRLFSDHIRNKHPEIFDKNNLYSCRHCSENFATNFEKLAHMKKCDSKLFPCEDHCNKRFATEWLLKNHMKHVMGEERFSCEVCAKRCVSRSDLQIHCRSHTNERPYSCPICHKSFKTSANRSSHLDIHESEKRHECEVCGEFIDADR